MTSTAELITFDDMLPRLMEEYALPRGELTPFHPLADQANRLTPAFAELSDHIWTALPTTDFSGVSDHTELARGVASSAAIVAAKQQDVRSFAESICFEAVEIRVRGQHYPEAKAAAIRSAREPLCRAVHQVNRPLEPVLTADLIAQPLNEITPVVNNWFRESCHTIAAQLLLSMHVLVELDVVGLIEWTDETTCKLNYYRHLVTQDRIHSRQTESVQSRSNDNGESWMRFETWEQVEGRNRYAVNCHEHHVMNAIAQPIREAQYPIPGDKQAFLDRVPGWIRQHLRILEGNQFLERVVERKVREEEWETAPTLRSSYEVETTPEVRSSFELDPAILLGHYVITGWDQREIEREIFQRKPITAQQEPAPRVDHRKRKQAGKTYDLLRPWAMATAAGATALMLFSRLQPAAMVPLAVLLTIAAILVSGRCVMNFSEWKHATIDWLFVTAASVTVAGGLFAVQSLLYGIMFGRWSMVGVAAVVGLMAFIASGIAGSRMEG